MNLFLRIIMELIISLVIISLVVVGVIIYRKKMLETQEPNQTEHVIADVDDIITAKVVQPTTAIETATTVTTTVEPTPAKKKAARKPAARKTSTKRSNNT